MMSKLVLNISDLSIGYKTVLQSKINLSAEISDLICIVGKNGAGKSTLIKTLAGVLPELSGDIVLEERNIKKNDRLEKARLISYVPSKLSIFSRLTVLELVSMGRTPYTNIFDRASEEDMRAINDAIDIFGISELKNKSLMEISDGERQKAMICRAFTQNTRIIILDEPSAFLDYPSKIELYLNLKSLAKEKFKTIIFSSHDLELSMKFVDKVWIFTDNQIIENTIPELKENKLMEKLFSYCFKNI